MNTITAPPTIAMPRIAVEKSLISPVASSTWPKTMPIALTMRSRAGPTMYRSDAMNAMSPAHSSLERPASSETKRLATPVRSCITETSHT